MPALSNAEATELITKQIPLLLKRDPKLAMPLYEHLLQHFADRDELGRLWKQSAEFRTETRKNFEKADQGFEQFRKETGDNFKKVDERFDQSDQRFEQFRKETQDNFKKVDERFEKVDERFDQVDKKIEDIRQDMQEGFKEVYRRIDRLGGRWGIRNESLFRETMVALLEKSFKMKVRRQYIRDEEFDVIISNGEHILIEITASAKRNIVERLKRKRDLYASETGITPTRFIFAVASIHTKRANALEQAGFEVIEPEEDE